MTSTVVEKATIQAKVVNAENLTVNVVNTPPASPHRSSTGIRARSSVPSSSRTACSTSGWPPATSARRRRTAASSPRDSSGFRTFARSSRAWSTSRSPKTATPRRPRFNFIFRMSTMAVNNAFSGFCARPSVVRSLLPTDCADASTVTERVLSCDLPPTPPRLGSFRHESSGSGHDKVIEPNRLTFCNSRR